MSVGSVTPAVFKSEDVETQQSAKWKNRANCIGVLKYR